MEGWNGVGILPSPETERVELVSDTSGSWGCATVWGTQWRWSTVMAYCSERAPSSAAIVHSVGEGLVRKDKSGAMAVVEVLNNSYSRDREMMHLL